MGKRPRESWPLTEQQKQLVAENYRLAFKFSVKHRPPPGMDQDDWRSECVHRLCVAATSYDKTIGPFSTYAFLSMLRHRWHLYQFQTYHKRDCRRTVPIGETSDWIADQRNYCSDADREDARYCLSLMDEREVQIVSRRVEGETFAEIGRSMGVCRERVRQLYDRALERVRVQLRVA